MSDIIKLLSHETGLSPRDVEVIINKAPVSYKRYTIPKRSGGRRLIAQPAREVKRLQRILVASLSKLPVHPAAIAYVRGMSIRDNAERHAANGPIMKFDFKDFFPSIREYDWEYYCRKHNLFSDEKDINFSKKLFFTRISGSTILRLAIGAPSSPWLSNVLMYEFDEMISDAVAKDKVAYTRYADDLTFSAKRTGFLNQVERSLRTVIAKIQHPRLTINDEKTVLSTMKFRRVVTGLVLANDGRVTIGRERKRAMRAALHHAFSGKLDGEALGRLAGLIAYVKGVEPAYFEELALRYGADIIERLNSPDFKDQAIP